MPGKQKIRVKLCLVGDSAVGKTSLIKRLLYDTFDEKYIPTPSTSVHRVEYEFPEVDGIETTLLADIWDISGQKAFLKFLKKDFFEKAWMIVGVCDVSRSETLYSLREWIGKGREIAGRIPVQLVGNKADLPKNVIRYDPELKKLIAELESNIYYLSARTGENVDFAFQEIVSALLYEVKKKLTEREGSLEFEWEILSLVAGRGKLGASKDFFFQEMKGIGFDTLKENLESLEKKGFLRVSWTGSTDFVAHVTETGKQKAEEGPTRFDSESLDLVTESIA